MSARVSAAPCDCPCAAKIRRLEAQVRKAEQNTARLALLLDMLRQVTTDDWEHQRDLADPAGAQRRKRERRMAQARIKGVI